MALIGTSLSAVTAVGPGAVLAFDKPRHAVAQVSVTGSPSSFQINIEGSIDGINFYTIGAAVAAGYVFANQNFVSLYVRANLVSFSGGSSPTFTAIITADDWS